MIDNPSMYRVVIRLAAAVGLVVALAVPALAQNHPVSLIRDAEIENTVRSYATPLLNAARINPDSVNFYIIDDDAINSFVAGGMNIFVHTGLLEISDDDPTDVIGVLAHEIGHIAGGHLVRTPDALNGASMEAMISYILGAAVLVAGGGQAGAAIMATGSSLAQSAVFSYSRSQEQKADQAGVNFLEASRQSPRGMLETFLKLKKQELLVARRQSPFLRTHPLTDDRIEFIRQALRDSPYANTPPRSEFVVLQERMVAKLHGFQDPPGNTLARYPESDTSLPARYARAIAYHKLADLPHALALIDGLLAEHPDDPYFHELRGQVLFENGRVGEAVPSYERAVALMPDEPLFRLELAQAEIETGDPTLNQSALMNLRKAVVRDRTNPGLWRYLGIAYGRDGQLGLSSLALAEEALLRGHKEDVMFYAGRAEEQLPEGSPGWLRLQDLKRAAEDLG